MKPIHSKFISKKGIVIGLVLTISISMILLGFTTIATDEFDVDIRLNKSFTVKLPTNPSTGYRWYWEHEEGTRMVDSLRRKYIGDQPARPGTGGEDCWTFKGIQKGTCTLHFVYKRPGLGQSPAQTKAIQVRVR